MAQRPYFIVSIDSDKIYKEETCEFTFYSGFSITQKQKSIRAMHQEIFKKYPQAKILEVSRKSENTLGTKLSAFNLIFNDDNLKRKFPVENIFQSSKVFSNGGPYTDLLYCHPREAKQDERLKSSGELIKFQFNDENWDLEPKTMFYDWIYIKALSENIQLVNEVTKYDIFTDIEFNPQKSFNCQARSVSIFVNLYKKGILEGYLKDKKKFKSIYKNDIYIQQKLF